MQQFISENTRKYPDKIDLLLQWLPTNIAPIFVKKHHPSNQIIVAKFVKKKGDELIGKESTMRRDQ